MSRPRPPQREQEARVVRALRTLTNETEVYVAAAGREQAMYRTDLAGLAVVMDQTNQGHDVTPGLLSNALNLSAPATSAMLDRLEKVGHVRRSPHPRDRRSVVVEMTDHAREVGGTMFARLGAHMSEVFDGYDEEQLSLIAGFLERACAATRAATADTQPYPR